MAHRKKPPYADGLSGSLPVAEWCDQWPELCAVLVQTGAASALMRLLEAGWTILYFYVCPSKIG